jgi:hypothetical protein
MINIIENPYYAITIYVQVKNLLQFAKEKINSIQLCWIPGYSNIIGNKITDHVAKDSTANILANTVQIIMKQDLILLINIFGYQKGRARIFHKQNYTE